MMPGAALIVGPLAWALNQGIGYAVVKPVCTGAAIWVLWAIAGATLLLALTGAWIGWRALRTLHATGIDDGPTVADRSYFIALIAVGLNALIALLIVDSLIPQFLLSPCE